MRVLLLSELCANRRKCCGNKKAKNKTLATAHCLLRPSICVQLGFLAFVLLSARVSATDHSGAASAVGGESMPANAVAQGLKATRMRTSKVANIHVLQAVPESLPNANTNDNDPIGSKAEKEVNDTSIPAGKFEIHSVSGEPSYKSVNLTWEVEFVQSPQDIITNSSNEIEPPTAFQLYFCELQSFGPHRCRSKVVNETASDRDSNDDNDLNVIEKIRQVRQYAALVDNLRMATKYSFHIRSMPKHKQLKKITGRSEVFNNEVEGADDFLTHNYLSGPTIVIPTKGFSAQATQCLPNASEIEVETGPNFGGKIVVDGGSCGIKGDPNDTKDKYVMRIDHKSCGSMVKPETNTVETFITVQENLGIFTHSTRRFVVVCSYQSGLQTVRASFSVPGRGGASAVAQPQTAGEEEDRMGRGLRPIRYVDKSELILKEPLSAEQDSSSEEIEALVEEMANPILTDQQNETKMQEQAVAAAAPTSNNITSIDFATSAAAAAAAAVAADHEDDNDTLNTVAILENIIPGVNEDEIKSKVHNAAGQQSNGKDNDEAAPQSGDGDNGIDDERFSAKFAKLILERNDRDHDEGDGLIEDDVSTPTGRAMDSVLELLTTNVAGIVLTVFASVIFIGIFIVVLYRETRRINVGPRPTAPMASMGLPRHQHLKESHTLPRTLRTRHQDIMA